MIILLGGASGTGKSQVSYRLAAHLGVPLVEVDDIVEALQAMTTPEQLPLLHFWNTQPHPTDPAQIAGNYLMREPEAGDQSGRAKVSRMYGDWLAQREGAIVVPARPWSDVLERVLKEVVDR